MNHPIANCAPPESEPQKGMETREVRIPPAGLAGTLRYPRQGNAVVVFAHGSGSSRLSPRNRAVAEGLNTQEFGTLLFDLLTLEEEGDRANVFDVTLLAERLGDAVNWLDRESPAAPPAPRLFTSRTGAPRPPCGAAPPRGPTRGQ